MARAPNSGAYEAAGSDLASLTRIMRRISLDTTRPQEKRHEMAKHLLAVIQTLQSELVGLSDGSEKEEAKANGKPDK